MTKGETNPDGAPELWDANEVARYLRVSRSWVYQRAESGELPWLRVGGLVRFDPEAIRAFAHGEMKPPRCRLFQLLRREKAVDCGRGRAMLIGVDGLEAHELSDAARSQ